MRRMRRPQAVRGRRRPARPHRRAWDHTDRDAVLRRPRRAGSPATPACSSSAEASSRPDNRGPSDRQSCLGRRLTRAGARTALDCRPDRPADIGVRDLRAGGRYLLALGLSQQGRRGPTAQKCTHFARRIRRRAGQLAALAADRASLSRLTPYHCDGPCMRVSRLPAPAARWLCAPAGQPRYTVPREARRHVRRRLRARCAGAYWRTIAVTMCPGKSGHK
jgi:hypothetical protein